MRPERFPPRFERAWVYILVKLGSRCEALTYFLNFSTPEQALGLAGQLTEISYNCEVERNFRSWWQSALPLSHCRVADLSLLTSLTDLGEVPAHLVIQQEIMPAVTSPSPNPTETAEYRAALEIEMWKERQEKAFEKQVIRKGIECIRF